MSIDRRRGDRYLLTLPVRVEWQDENGNKMVEEGLTENIGPYGALIHLPRFLPAVGSQVQVVVTNDNNKEVSAAAEVLRLERNAAHPQLAVDLVDSVEKWQKQLWSTAPAVIAKREAEEEYDDF